MAAVEPGAAPTPPPRRRGAPVAPQTWPTADELVSEVLPGCLYLGPYLCARTPGFADSQVSRTVASQVNCDPNLELIWPDRPATRVAIVDQSPPVDNIIELMCTAAEAISTQPKPVYIHCYEGVGRSASCVVAYLVLKEAMSTAAALAVVQTARPQTCPSPGYIAACAELERQRRRVESGGDLDERVDAELEEFVRAFELYYFKDGSRVSFHQSQ